MTREQVSAWCGEHADMKHQMEDLSSYDEHYKIRFVNGDSYEYRAKYDGAFAKTTTISINGEVVNVTSYTWQGFEWHEAIDKP